MEKRFTWNLGAESLTDAADRARHPEEVAISGCSVRVIRGSGQRRPWLAIVNHGGTWKETAYSTEARAWAGATRTAKKLQAAARAAE